MDWLELLYKFLELCIVPLLGLATAYFIKWMNLPSLNFYAPAFYSEYPEHL